MSANKVTDIDKEFWKTKTLDELSVSEWESLCDGCGLCCLVRVEDETSGEVFDTNVICGNYDCSKKQCSSYQNRTTLADGCVQLTLKLVEVFDWLPDSCAYRTVARGEDLPETHPLKRDGLPREKTVVEYFAPIGLIQNSGDVIHEEHLIYPEDIDYS